MHELDEIEICFNVRVNVYKLTPCKNKHKGRSTRVETVRISGYGNKSTPFISLDYWSEGRHFSLIKNIQSYMSKFEK